MSGHTPGPWTWDRVPLPGLGSNRWCDVLNGSGPAVLRHEASGGPTPWGVSEPDKALIAAAPDLLEALREIAKGEGRFSRDPLEHASNTIDDMKAIAEAAIAKAEDR